MPRFLFCFVAVGMTATFLPEFVRGEDQEPTRQEMQQVAAKFKRNCQHCHQPPDLNFASDRAWLDQLKRTA